MQCPTRPELFHPILAGGVPAAAGNMGMSGILVLTQRLTCARRLIVSTGPLEQQPGDIMLAPGVAEFASEALRGAGAGGHYTGEIEFSGRSARVARRLSSHRASGVRLFI